MDYTPVTRLRVVREGSMEGRPRINSTTAACEFAANFFEYRGSDREEVVVVHLDTKYRPISVSVATTGTLDSSLIHPREVFKGAIVAGAAAILVMHNHPSGDSVPSYEDKQATKMLKDAAKVLGIKVLDHIVVGEDCTSLAETCGV